MGHVLIYLAAAGSTLSSSNGPNAHNGHIRPALDILDSPALKRRSKHMAKLRMGDAKDDIHVCIMCLRAIMNNKVMFLNVSISKSSLLTDNQFCFD